VKTVAAKLAMTVRDVEIAALRDVSRYAIWDVLSENDVMSICLYAGHLGAL
jgi:hypothetical protein